MRTIINQLISGNKLFGAITLTLILSVAVPALNKKMAEHAILEVIERESKAFWDKDFKAYADCWAHEDYVRTMGWWAEGGITVVEGWSDRGKRTKSHMDENPNPNPQNPLRKNMNIRVGKDMAWVTFDQYGKDTDDPTFDMPGLSRETRILEKIDGAWKIVYVGWLLQGE
jgi:hypothetical protein